MKCTLNVGSLSLYIYIYIYKGKVEGPDLTSFVRHFPADSKGITFSTASS